MSAAFKSHPELVFHKHMNLSHDASVWLAINRTSVDLKVSDTCGIGFLDGKLFEFNLVGALIFDELTSQGTPWARLIEKISLYFDVTVSRAEDECQKFLGELFRLGFLVEVA